jgi:serine/threonine-protein kinase RsbW
VPEPAVQIETPATGAYLAVVRAAATGLAAGLDFTYEQIDDLRIAVDEACAQLLAHRAGAQVLRVAYALEEAALTIEVTVDGPGGGPPAPLPKDSFGWQILRAVTDEVDERIDDGRVLVAFRKRGGTR